MSLVFQYGSNASRARLLGPKRLNEHGIVAGLAETVEDYEIAFDVLSSTNKCAASDLVSIPGRKAWGVLYDIPEEFIRGRRTDRQKTLAEIEGPKYEEVEIQVRQRAGDPVRAITFLVKASERKAKLATGVWYVSWIVYGLREQGAPEEYIKHVLHVAIEANRRAEPVAQEQIELISSL